MKSVSAEDNSQMRLYALGAYNSFGLLYDVDAITATIVQPRLDSISSESLVAPFVGAWIEISMSSKENARPYGRTLRGCVD